MSEEAWQIIALYFTGGGYQEGVLRSFAGWTLKSMLNADESIDAAQVLHGGEFTQNKWERALRELVDLGLIEENPNLGERWCLVLKKHMAFSRGDRVEETYYGYGQGIVAFFNGEEVDGCKFKTTLEGGVYVKFDNPSVGETWIEGEYLRKLEDGQ